MIKIKAGASSQVLISVIAILKRRRREVSKREEQEAIAFLSGSDFSLHSSKSLECYPIWILKFINLEWEFLHLLLVDLSVLFPKLWSPPEVMHFVVVVTRSLIRPLELSAKNTFCTEFFPQKNLATVRAIS